MTRGGNWYVFININAIVDSAYQSNSLLILISIPEKFIKWQKRSSTQSSAPKATILFFPKKTTLHWLHTAEISSCLVKCSQALDAASWLKVWVVAESEVQMYRNATFQENKKTLCRQENESIIMKNW